MRFLSIFYRIELCASVCVQVRLFSISFVRLDRSFIVCYVFFYFRSLVVHSSIYPLSSTMCLRLCTYKYVSVCDCHCCCRSLPSPVFLYFFSSSSSSSCSSLQLAVCLLPNRECVVRSVIFMYGNWFTLNGYRCVFVYVYTNKVHTIHGIPYGCIEWISLYLCQLFVQIAFNDRFEPMYSCVWSNFTTDTALLLTRRSRSVSLALQQMLHVHVYLPPIYIGRSFYSVFLVLLHTLWLNIFIIVIMIPVWFDTDSPCLFFHILAACVVHVDCIGNSEYNVLSSI